jgi:hypothetical protein
MCGLMQVLSATGTDFNLGRSPKAGFSHLVAKWRVCPVRIMAQIQYRHYAVLKP